MAIGDDQLTDDTQQVDYTPAIAELTFVLAEIRDHLGSVRDHLSKLAEQGSTRQTHMARALAIFERAADVERGLVSRPANDDGLNTAAMVVALREAGMLDAVLAEQGGA
ncbi:hypothetical protein [Halomonas organivorans]|uniref:Uncharacterized protein n=1 Tax=Halomonas organivorans TaxID=257772 RepID=A0A7W5BY07_9GAMM|nr:hypothetical protein [Halomonas organivorans]MBB3141209.1 hypothetical protein [Halomonas organivorans]